MDLYEALYTTRAMRRVSPDPVPDDVVRSMIDAAIRAPSGSNAQSWRFVTVTDAEIKAQLGPLYRAAWDLLLTTVYSGRDAADEQGQRVTRSASWLAENFEVVPMWLMALSRNDPSGASIYPAVWNAMLAARGHGVGTCLTTVLGIFKQAEAFEILGVPDGKGWQLAAAVSCGYPLGRWDVAARRPAHEVAFAERWGEPVRWEAPEPLWP